MAKVLNLPVAVVQLAWPKHDWQQKLDEFVIADIQDKADFLASENSGSAAGGCEDGFSSSAKLNSELSWCGLRCIRPIGRTAGGAHAILLGLHKMSSSC